MSPSMGQLSTSLQHRGLWVNSGCMCFFLPLHLLLLPLHTLLYLLRALRWPSHAPPQPPSAGPYAGLWKPSNGGVGARCPATQRRTLALTCSVQSGRQQQPKLPISIRARFCDGNDLRGVLLMSHHLTILQHRIDHDARVGDDASQVLRAEDPGNDHRQRDAHGPKIERPIFDYLVQADPPRVSALLRRTCTHLKAPPFCLQIERPVLAC